MPFVTIVVPVPEVAAAFVRPTAVVVVDIKVARAAVATTPSGIGVLFIPTAIQEYPALVW